MSENTGTLKTEINNESNTDSQKPAIISFSPEQQTKVNEIVQSAMGRAAAETRKKLADTESQLKQLQEKLAANPSESEAIELAKAQAAEAERTAQELREEIVRSKREALLTQLGSNHGFVDSSIVSKIAGESLRWNEEQKRFDVVNMDGSVKLDPKTFEPMKPAAFVAEFATLHPYLVKSDVRGGNGSSTSDRSSFANPRGQYEPEQIFGRKSSSKLANDLARKDPAEYARLKARAKAEGLI